MTETSHIGEKNRLTQAAFDKLLAALDADRDAAGAKYLELRENLRRFFTWRGTAFPEDNADETLNRAARKLESGEAIEDLRRFVFGIARLLCLELHRSEERNRAALAEIPNVQNADDADAINRQTRLDCLETCLAKLSGEDRSFIVDYYQGEKITKIANRKTLLERLKLSPGGLRMRALRLRERLENCLRNCLAGAAD